MIDFSTYPFDRFSAHAQRALLYARQEAEDNYADQVGTEHVLLGLFRVGDGSGYRALKALEVDEIKLRAKVNRIHLDRERAVDPNNRDNMVRAVLLAFEHGTKRKASGAVRTGDLLVGLAQSADGTAAQLLRELGIEPSAIVAAVDHQVASS